MNPVSPEFPTALRGSHRLAVEVDVLQFGQPFMSGLQVVDGTVTLDGGAAVYGQCEITVIEPARFATVDPLGLELAVRSGVIGHRPDPELIGLGVFKIVAYDFDATTGELRLSGMDRSRYALDALLEDDVEIPAGTLVVDAVRAFIATAVPHAPQELPAGVYTVPASVFEIRTAPWDAVQELVGAIGKQPRFDGLGTFRLVDVTPPSTPPAWIVDEGPQGVLMGSSMTASDTNVYNRVIASSPPDDAGVVYKATVTDTTSGARYDGPFGHKPTFIESDLFTSDEMCLAAAQGRLDTGLGAARSVSFSAVPNCALVPGDVILLRDTRLGVDTKYVIEQLTIGLGVEGEMTGTTRQAL